MGLISRVSSRTYRRSFSRGWLEMSREGIMEKDANDNAISKLNMMAQFMNIKTPAYTVANVVSGAKNDNKFKCNGTFGKATATAFDKSKKDAKHKCADALLAEVTKVYKKTYAQVKIEHKTAKSKGNYKGPSNTEQTSSASNENSRESNSTSPSKGRSKKPKIDIAAIDAELC